MLDGDALAAWLRQRAGKLTASNMPKAIAVKKDGSRTAEGVQLMYNILAERLTGDSIRHFVNPAMQWGLDKESDAKAAWQALTGDFIRESTFYDHPRIDMFGATPDGELAGGGLIEIKAPTTPTFVGWVMAGIVPPEHEPQMLAQLACTGRKWVEFCAFDPRLKDPTRQLFIRRFEPAAEQIAKIEAAAEQFLREVDELWELFHERAA